MNQNDEIAKEAEEIIGPNPCEICSGEYGEHEKDCKHHRYANVNLLPCPFCGCRVEHDEDYGHISCIHSGDDKHCGFYYECVEGLSAETIAKWNTRPARDTIAQEREKELRERIERLEDVLKEIAKFKFALTRSQIERALTDSATTTLPGAYAEGYDDALQIFKTKAKAIEGRGSEAVLRR